MYSVTKRFEFDTAHRLLGYDGKCKHIHGHHYVAEVTVSGKVLDHNYMLIDFKDLKELVGTWIDDNWDHNLLICNHDPLWQDMPANNMGRDPFNTGKELPTAEVMARLLYQRVVDVASSRQHPSSPWKHLCVTNVRIYETPDCWADYNAE